MGKSVANCYECDHNEEFNTKFVWCVDKQWHVDPCHEQDCKRFKSRLERQLSPSEAVHGFAAWLTSREKEVTMSKTGDPHVVAELVHAYCDKNKLSGPGGGWWAMSKSPGDSYISQRERQLAETFALWDSIQDRK